MIEIDTYMNMFFAALKETYGARLLYMGLQGSYRRGGADQDSDIDIMVVLDELHLDDMSIYKKILASIDCSAKSCGFICGKKELANWNPCEICQLVHETKDYVGCLERLVPTYSLSDIKTHVKVCVGNLYHEICHRYIHSTMEDNKLNLRHSYKQVFYILQNLYFLRKGEFINTKKELLARLDRDDLRVLQTALELRSNADYEFNKAYRLLFEWSQRILQTI